MSDLCDEDAFRNRHSEEVLEEGENQECIIEACSSHIQNLINPEKALDLAAEGVDVTDHIKATLSPNVNGNGTQGAVEEEEPVRDAKQITMSRFDPNLSQKRRRELTLDWQRKYGSILILYVQATSLIALLLQIKLHTNFHFRRRDEILEKIRHLETDSGVSDSEPEDSLDFLEVAKKCKSKKAGKWGDRKSEVKMDCSTSTPKAGEGPKLSWKERHHQRQYTYRVHYRYESFMEVEVLSK
jgi:hypothetical protein